MKDWDNNCCGGGKKSVKSEFCTFIEVRRKYTTSCPPHHTRSVGMSFQSDRRDFKTRKINIEKIDLSLEIHNALAAVESRRIGRVLCFMNFMLSRYFQFRVTVRAAAYNARNECVLRTYTTALYEYLLRCCDVFFFLLSDAT